MTTFLSREISERKQLKILQSNYLSSMPLFQQKSNNNCCIDLPREKLKTFSFSLENQTELNPNKAWWQCSIVENLLAETLQYHFKSLLCLISKPVSKITDSTSCFSTLHKILLWVHKKSLRSLTTYSCQFPKLIYMMR